MQEKLTHSATDKFENLVAPHLIFKYESTAKVCLIKILAVEWRFLIACRCNN